MYKTVLITGASRGIGRAIACAFAREGCRLVINCSRSEKELLALADVLHQGEHLLTQRRIERREGLIQQQHLRLKNQRSGNRHALALAAGKLVRITVAKRPI